MYSKFRRKNRSQSYESSRWFELKFQTGCLIFIFVFTFALCFGEAYIKVANPQTYTVTVQSKDIKSGSKSGKFLVFCIDTNTGESRVFEVTDSLFKWRFDSADIYNMIKEGETYEFTTGGYRVPFLSMYPNIYEVNQVQSQEIPELG